MTAAMPLLSFLLSAHIFLGHAAFPCPPANATVNGMMAHEQQEMALMNKLNVLFFNKSVHWLSGLYNSKTLFNAFT